MDQGSSRTAGPAAPGRLDAAVLPGIDRRLAEADRLLASRYPGDAGSRQPLHTVYVPADQTDVDTPARWGAAALDVLDAAVPDAASAARVTGLGGIDEDVHRRVRAKLAGQPVEDLRVDFEDGYGARPDAEEDAAAAAAGAALAGLLTAAACLSFAGIRVKSRSRQPAGAACGRSISSSAPCSTPARCRTASWSPCPRSPRPTRCGRRSRCASGWRSRTGLAAGRLRFEIQVETPQAILGADGVATIAPMVHAAGSRCVGLHYGTYDYSAACGVAAAYQSLEHAVADHAKAVMQVAAAGTGVRLSDGSTNVLPAGTPEQVRDALRLHARLVRRSLERGYYQGWDMHPGHLVTRYLAAYGFYREGLDAAADRLRGYLSRTGGGVLDEPATAQALASFLTRGLHCGALDDSEVAAATGLSREALDALARRRPLPESRGDLA